MFLKLLKNIGANNPNQAYKLTILCFSIALASYAQDIEVKQLKINTDLDHFSATVVNGDKVFFSHNLKNRRGKPIKDRFDGFVYNLFEGRQSETAEIIDVKAIKRTREGQFNMSVATFTKDGKYMYFTTNNLAVGDNKMKDFKTYHLQIQRAEFKNGRWANFTSLPFCKLDTSYGHPALSPDGKTLYFVAKIEDTKGKTDIYKVSINNHDTYGEPVRLSDQINSPRSEVYPFISDDNVLYFSSNRRGGVGGYDIYKYDLKSTNPELKPEALPSPLNTRGEEFSFFLNTDLTSGYITSRRTRSKGRDDIYYFTGY